MNEKEPYLLKCPFCGVRPGIFKVTLYTVQCANRKCPAQPEVVGRTKKDVTTGWNKRD